MLINSAITIWNKADINHRINIKARLALLRDRPNLTALVYRSLISDDTVGSFCDNIYRLTGRSVMELARNEKPVSHIYLSADMIANKIKCYKEAKRYKEAIRKR